MNNPLKNPNSDKKLIISGVIWNIVRMGINQSFAFVTRLVLAKLLFPEQFGLVGMAMVFNGLVQVLNNLGIGAALVQFKEKNLREEHYHTAFWTGVIWSATLYLIMFFVIAPLAASFYNEPMLISIIPVMSIGILCSPLNLVHVAQLTKRMNFKRITFIDNTSNIGAGILALVLAFMGAGVWSLVFNSVATILIAIPLYFKSTGWTPKLMWDKKAFKDIFGFGAYTTGSNILNYCYNNVDYLLIGKLLSAPVLGAYTLAFSLTDIFRNKLMLVINNVMYPVYAKNQHDPIALKKYYLKVVQLNCILIFPVMVFFAVSGEAFIISFFGEKWRETVLPLQILAVSVMFHIMVTGNTSLIRGLGRPGLEMKLQIVKAAIFLPMLIAGIYFYGIAGAAWAILINKIIIVIIAQYTFSRLITVKISTLEFLLTLKAPLLASCVSFLIAYALNFSGINYLIGLLALFSSYASVVWLFMHEELKAQYKDLRKKKSLPHQHESYDENKAYQE